MRRKIVKVFSYYHINLEHSKNAPKILKCVTAVRWSDLRQVIKFRPFLKFRMGSFEVCGMRLKLFTIYSLTLKSYERSFKLSEHLASTLYTRHASLAVSGLELACCLSGWRLPSYCGLGTEETNCLFCDEWKLSMIRWPASSTNLDLMGQFIK